MNTRILVVLTLCLFAPSAFADSIQPKAVSSSGWTLVGWNDLGMHCMDSDYSVFSILPPYNTIHAQLIDASGKLVKGPAGILVTYQAIADADGSINTTSQGKTNFWQYVQPLYGASPAPDVGLAGSALPGSANQPQPMTFDPSLNWLSSVGIPLTPYDDAGKKNTYPMMRLVASDSTGAVLATTGIVLPVSDEMDCRACHSSGSAAAAQPAAGWVNDPNSDRDYRLNILRLHDERQGGSLFASVTVDQKPILCASCHASNALAGTGMDGIPPLTQSMHAFHAKVSDPVTGLTLDASANRSACYRCHPGSTTQCLRGVMGAATAADGSMVMQCQSCHGSMSTVGASTRQGWFQEPACQNCHSGATQFTSAFDDAGAVRQPADLTFATNPDTPAPGLSLYRFSTGHGGLQCEACHGSTHAEFPSTHANDNVQSIQLQGYAGTVAECSACHATTPNTTNGGPHGLHPIGQTWVTLHQRAARGSTTACQFCHGADYRGTVLSKAQTNRVFNAGELGTKSFPKGHQMNCYDCHNGPRGD